MEFDQFVPEWEKLQCDPPKSNATEERIKERQQKRDGDKKIKAKVRRKGKKKNPQKKSNPLQLLNQRQTFKVTISNGASMSMQFVITCSTLPHTGLTLGPLGDP